MDPLTIAAASGIRSRIESLELLANNLANQTTAGYKSDQPFYSLYVAPEALGFPSTDGTGPPTLPVVERQWTNFAQGMLTPTGNPLDLGISGPGFFTVRGPSGLLYTRNGHFHLSRGGVIETEEGYPLLDSKKVPIRLDPQRPVTITSGGLVQQNGQTVATVRLVRFPDSSVLRKRAGSYFFSGRGKVQPVPAAGAKLVQGKLEDANVSPAEAAVRLVDVMRQFEMLQRAVHLGTEMYRKAIEDVARVGS